jgi:hypothetical protein
MLPTILLNTFPIPPPKKVSPTINAIATRTSINAYSTRLCPSSCLDLKFIGLFYGKYYFPIDIKMDILWFQAL